MNHANIKAEVESALQRWAACFFHGRDVVAIHSTEDAQLAGRERRKDALHLRAAFNPAVETEGRVLEVFIVYGGAFASDGANPTHSIISESLCRAVLDGVPTLTFGPPAPYRPALTYGPDAPAAGRQGTIYRFGIRPNPL